MASSSTISLGNVLFRFRSFTPVPVIALTGFLLWRSRGTYGPGGPYGAWPGCGCGSLFIILGGIFLVCGGILSLFNGRF